MTKQENAIEALRLHLANFQHPEAVAIVRAVQPLADGEDAPVGVRIEIAFAEDTGKVKTEGRALFPILAPLVGLDPTDLDRTFGDAHHLYRVEAIRPRKGDVVVERDDGQIVFLPPKLVASGLAEGGTVQH